MTVECAASANLWEVAKITVPAIVIAVGWVVVHKLNIKREIRHLQRSKGVEQCDLLISAARELKDLALSYHLNDRDRNAERRIVAQFTELGILCSSLARFGLKRALCDEVVTCVTDFKIASTGWHFDDEHDGKKPGDAPEVAAIDITHSILLSRALNAKIDLVAP